MADSSAPDDPRLWRQVATPFADVHPGHRLSHAEAIEGGGSARLWPPGIVWEPVHLDVPSNLLDLICANDETLADALTRAGLLHYGLGLRRMLSGRVLARVERALGRRGWQRLTQAEEAFAALAVEPQWPLEDLITAGAGERVDGAGATLLASAFAAHGEPWRLRLGLRLAPSLHEAVLAAEACEPRLAVRRLAWLADGQLPAAEGSRPADAAGMSPDPRPSSAPGSPAAVPVPRPDLAAGLHTASDLQTAPGSAAQEGPT